ncbi:hypothetical protein A9Q99_20095 [Gammaproteobacteria bacterium 45_16_T64]|nr:hypothetical protein A9Q99_20095 [Gammaproteobacteria bacterium 45_16_T64]
MSLLLRLKILIGCLSLLWVVGLVNYLLNYSLNEYGIVPREFVGLRGVVLSPLLHGSVQHLAVNSVSFVLFGGLLIARGVKFFVFTILFVGVVGGLGVWMIADAGSVHVGASGVVFGMFGFLMFRGFFAKKPLDLLISFAVIFLYGGVIWGVLPGEAGVSWESHLCGFLAGALFAYCCRIKD